MSVNVKDLLTATAYDNNGDKVGDVNEVFVDDSSGQPTFVDVNHGLFGMGNSLVPLRGHSLDGDNLTLAYAKERIKGAPDFDADKPLTPEQQTEIYQHYGVSESSHLDGYTGGERPRDERPGNENTFAEGPYTGTSHTDASADTTAEQSHLDGGPVGAAGAGAGAGLAGAGAADAAASAGTDTNSTEEPTASSNDNTLIRNEEHLNVGTERVETGEARLRKYVVTETETVEVPVSHEEVRVERTPISAEEAEAQAKSGGLDANRSEDASVTLHEERPVVNKETIPVEKVNLSTEEVSDTERVTEEVRKEQIDADGIDSFDDK
ncbi:PRC and DUF2382 domain-containing protein [Corynebacterium stationis]|uniref:PRC and DUF2382 domain-containing protein n=1 Tax=Corynebacterium stationis TaxID=1705 RepID=UPI00242AA41E|nr:PRC and DUF2382 domain-containing protein [Corynebacterium stationis]